MSFSARVFWAPKAGNTHEEYEDASWPLTATEVESGIFRCAVADGATESSFSGEWARLLVEAYRQGANTETKILKTLPTVSEAWSRDRTTESLPWYAQTKLQSGAYSSLVGLTIRGRAPELEGRWKALAVGDSCLFQVRGENLITAFPLDRSQDFNNRPRLLSTIVDNEELAQVQVAKKYGAWREGDRFYLMTDALAAWFLSATENGQSPWEEIDCMAEFSNHDDFAQWIEHLREAGSIRNDDVTLIHIALI